MMMKKKNVKHGEITFLLLHNILLIMLFNLILLEVIEIESENEEFKMIVLCDSD